MGDGCGSVANEGLELTGGADHVGATIPKSAAGGVEVIDVVGGEVVGE